MNVDEGKCLLIVNPAAKRGHGAEAGQVALRALRREWGALAVDVVSTQGAKHAAKLAAQAGGYRRVLALGGDGVVHETVNGLMSLPREERPALGVIPVGSGNDYARSLGMSFKLEEALAQLLSARLHTVDVGSCNGEYFDETLSFGLDAAVALGTVPLRARLHIGGAPLYLASGINEMVNHLDLYRFRMQMECPGDVIVEGLETGADGQSGEVASANGAGGTLLEVEGESIMFAVQVGPTYGGGFRICPDARLDDGLLDLCWAGNASLPRAAFLFMRAKNAGHVNAPEISFAQAASLHLEFDRRPPVQIDGEPHVADSYDIRLHPGALDVLMPG